MSPTPERESAPSQDDFYARYVSGLMTERALSPVQHAILRTLAVRVQLNPVGEPVRCSLPALAERIGRDASDAGTDVSEDCNRQVRQAYDALRTRKLVHAGRDGRGRGHSYRALVPDRWQHRREPAWPGAVGASKCLSLQVSPLGPTGERDYHELLWTVDSDGVRTGTRKEWSQWLGISSRRVLGRLHRLVAAGIGVSLEELPPEPRRDGERGREPLRYCVTVTKLPAGRFPDGAKRHRARQQQERERMEQLSAPVVPTREGAPRAYAIGEDGALVDVPYYADADEDLPDDLFDEAAVGGAVTEAAELTPEPTFAPAAEEAEPTPPTDDAVVESQHQAVSAELPRKSSRAFGPSAAEMEQQAKELRALLWYPELVDALIEVAEGRLKAGNRMSLRRRINYIYRPVVELQQQAANREALRDTLKTVHDECDALKKGGDFTRFARKVLARRLGTTPSAKQGTNAAASASRSPENLAATLRERLGEAYPLNKAGEHDQAQAVLAGLLEKAVPVVAPVLYDGDEKLARAAIVEAFKRGSSDAAPKPAPAYAAALNYLPESVWPHVARLACEDPVPASTPSAPALRHLATQRATQRASSARRPAAPTALGVQLTLDGTDGRRLMQRPDGKLEYEQRPARPERVPGAAAAPTAPESPENARVLTLTAPRTEEPDANREEERKAAALAALFAPRAATPAPSVEAVLRERFGVELETP